MDKYTKALRGYYMTLISEHKGNLLEVSKEAGVSYPYVVNLVKELYLEYYLNIVRMYV